MAAVVVLGCIMVLQLIAGPALVQGQLAVGFYRGKCPRGVDVESIVKDSITASWRKEKGIAPGITRLHFHDCFVNGPDGSVLINSTGSERSAGANRNLRGFEAIDAAKAAVEAKCPGVVSCADILAFAARDLVELSLGFRIKGLRSGRRDGLVSTTDVSALPRANQRVADLTTLFANQGLTQRDMVVLSGAHTIGVAHCNIINTRIYSPGPTDPPLEPAYVEQLKGICPQGTTDNSIQVKMDPVTPAVFDNQYYKNLQANKGLFISDQILQNDSTTAPIVESFAKGFLWRNIEYPRSFLKMADHGVKTGTEGEIRNVCWKFNSAA